MDIQLPGIDGLELTRQLKPIRNGGHDHRRPDAYAMKGDDVKAVAAGAMATSPSP